MNTSANSFMDRARVCEITQAAAWELRNARAWLDKDCATADVHWGSTCEARCDHGYLGGAVRWTCDSDQKWMPDAQVTPECRRDPDYCTVVVSSGCDYRGNAVDKTEIHRIGVVHLDDYGLAGRVHAIQVMGERCTVELLGEHGKRMGRVLHGSSDKTTGWYDCTESAAYGWGGGAHQLKIWKDSDHKCGHVAGWKAKKFGLAPCYAPF